MRLSLPILSLVLAAPALVPAAAGVPSVVTDVPAVHSLASQVMGDLGTPVLLLDGGADPHGFQLRPSQARALSEAAVVFWVGPELTPWMARALSGAGAGAAAIALLDVAGVHLRDYDAPVDVHASGHDDDVQGHAGQDHATRGHAGHDHAGHDHDTHDHDTHDHDTHDHVGRGEGGGDDHGGHSHAPGHDHTGTDPHAWLDPANARLWLDVIAAELARHDAANAAAYRANAEAAKVAVRAMVTRVAARLAQVDGAPVMVFHDAYGYFADHFGLNIAGSIALGDAAAPGAARLAQVRARLEAGQVVCIFPEANQPADYIGVVTEGTAVRTGAPLDPAGVTLEPGAGLYADLMEGLAAAIADCAGP